MATSTAAWRRGLLDLETCRLRNISLRLDDKGALIIGRSDLLGAEPPLWPSLLIAIEAHLEAVTALVAAGWCLNAKPLIEKAGGLSFDVRHAYRVVQLALHRAVQVPTPEFQFPPHPGSV